MHQSEILLLINSILLGLIGLMFVIIGYFLQDLHSDFKAIIARVNNLYADLNSNINIFANVSKMFQKQIDAIEKKLGELEGKIKTGKDE